jgi:uncharacterized membrane protein HdeD (DUF308 family)
MLPALLEVNFSGFDSFVFVLLIFVLPTLGAFVVSLGIAFIVKGIYEIKNKKKFSRKNFWLIILVCMLIFGLIVGMICFSN